jgi:hypothetical protein
MTTTPAERVAAYLDDVARMLLGAAPADRAEVLGGLREHIDAALADGPQPPGRPEVDRVLLELGPPEQVALAALEGAERTPGVGAPWLTAAAAPRPILTRPWVPAAGAALVALATVVLMPFALPVLVATGGLSVFVLPVVVLLALPWVAGAVLVTMSPLWSVAEKVAVWSLVPGAALLGALGAYVVRLSDTCARVGGTCTGTDPATAEVVGTSGTVLAVAGLTAVVARVGRSGARRSRSGLAPAAEPAIRPWTARWWVPLLAALGLAATALTAAAVPVLLAAHTYQGSTDGVRGVLIWPQGREAVLVGIGPVVLLWLGAVVLVASSPLWGRWATAVAAAVPPIMVAAASLAASGQVLSAERIALLPDVSVGLTVLGAFAIAAIWVAGARAAGRLEHRPGAAGGRPLDSSASPVQG